MKELTDPADLNKHLSPDGKTVVMFAMSGCPFCTMFKPVFDVFARDCSSKIECIRVNLDDYTDPLWEKYHIDITPTVLVFEKGILKKRIDGRGGRGLEKEDLKGI